MSQLFLALGFVQPDGRESDQVSIAHMWKIAGGDEEGLAQVPLHVVKVLMCAIQNFHIDWLIDEQRSEGGSIKAGSIGRREGNRLYLRSEEISHLTKKFHNLY